MDEERRYTPGWFPDPTGRFEVRYHNGVSWTGDVATNGQRFVDSLNAPGAPMAPIPAAGPVAGARNGAAVAALVLGIVAAATAWMPFVFVVGAICAVIAIALAVVARRRARTGAGRGGMATAGLVLGIVAVPLAIVGFLFTRIVLGMLDPGEYAVEVDCGWVAGRASLEGTITNLDDEERGYLVLVRFVREGTSSGLGDLTIQVDEVAPGATGTFTGGITTDVDAIDCEVVEVLGGVPFDIDG
jgi:hypothetical protein